MAITGASLQPIYDRLHAVQGYHPMSADTFADWSVEAGDIVTMSRDGEEIAAPIHNAKIVWRGSPQITLNATGNETRDSIARVSQKKYGRGGTGMRNDQKIRSEIYSTDSKLYSFIEQTETYILSVVADTANDLGSEILQTASQIRSEVHASNSQLYSYIDQTATYILSVVDDTANDLGSAILQTASQIRSEVHAANSQLYSYVDQTATYIISVVEDVESDLGSAILQTASQIRSEVHASNSQLYSYIDQTATYIISVVDDTANDLGSAILQTASQIRSEVHASNSQLYSYIDQTATYIISVVDDTANDLGSAILQTASQIRSEVHASNSQLYSYIDQTATYIISVVDDTANDLGSEILQTASQIRSEVHASESTLYSYIDSTATYIEQAVVSTESSLRGAIKTQADRISLVVEGTGSNAHIKAAQIVASINAQTGESQVKLAADKVIIDGTTTINQVFSVNSSGVNILKSVYIGAADEQMITLNRTTGSISCQQFIVPSGKDIEFRGTGGAISLDYADVSGMIIKAAVSGNTLKLWKQGEDTSQDPALTFSKATSLSGAWSSGNFPYTVSASPQGNTHVIGFGSYGAHDLDLELTIDGSPAVSETAWRVDVPVKLSSLNSGQTAPTKRYGTDIAVSLYNILDFRNGNSKITANGQYSPGEGYVAFGSITVDIAPVISHEWSNSGQLTVTTSPTAQENFVRRLTQGTTSWSSNTASVPIVAKYGSQDQYSEDTNLTVTVNATGRYRAGSVNVELPDFSSSSWSTLPNANITVSENTASISTTGRVDLNGDSANITRTLPIKTTQGDWNTTTSKKYVYVHYSTTADANRIARVQVDASGLVSDATAAGKNAVTIVKGSWSGGQISFTKSEGTASTQTVQLCKTNASWSGNTATVQIWDGTSADAQHGVNTGYTVTVDASGRYTAGQNAVTLNDPTYNTVSSLTGSRTITVSTNGRPTQLSKSVTVVLSSGSWSSGSIPIYIRLNSATGDAIAQGSVSMPSVSSTTWTNTTGRTWRADLSIGGVTRSSSTKDFGGYYTDGQNAVTLNDASWNSVSSLTASRTVTVSTSGRPTQLSKSKTVHLTVGSWSSGSIPIYIRDGSTSGTIVAQNSVSMPAVSSTTWTNTSGRIWRADLSIGGVTRSSSTKDFGGYYTDGVNSVTVSDVFYENGTYNWYWDTNLNKWYITQNLKATASNGASKSAQRAFYIQEFADLIYGSGMNDAYAAVYVVYDQNRRCVPVKADGTWTGNMGVDVGSMLDDSYASGQSAGYTQGMGDEKNRIRCRWGYYNGIYYVNAYENDGASNPSITASTLEYELKIIDNNMTRDAQVAIHWRNGGVVGESYKLNLADYWDVAYSSGQSTGYNLSWIGQGYVENTNQLPSGTQHQLTNLKTVIVNNRNNRGYIYFRIKINNDYHVYYFVDNGNGWTS